MEDLSEQEKVEELKKWWKENGTFIVAGLVLGSLALFGWQSWRTAQVRSAEQASDLYQQLVEAANLEDLERVSGVLVTLKDDYKNTPYASQGALVLAGMHVGKEDYDAAGEELRYTLDNLRGDEALGHVARLRLARVLLAADKTDEALALLDGKEDAAFASGYAEVKGDISVVLGDEAAALDYYENALSDEDLTPQRREMLAMKFQDLGGDPNASSDPGETP